MQRPQSLATSGASSGGRDQTFIFPSAMPRKMLPITAAAAIPANMLMVITASAIVVLQALKVLQSRKGHIQAKPLIIKSLFVNSLRRIAAFRVVFADCAFAYTKFQRVRARMR